jgi:hypothetical protein
MDLHEEKDAEMEF